MRDDPRMDDTNAPLRIADKLYYVGSQDLASYLVVTPQGNILINANISTSPPPIRASVEKLGDRWTDIKILLNSQAHSDHMDGGADGGVSMADAGLKPTCRCYGV